MQKSANTWFKIGLDSGYTGQDVTLFDIIKDSTVLYYCNTVLSLDIISWCKFKFYGLYFIMKRLGNLIFLCFMSKEYINVPFQFLTLTEFSELAWKNELFILLLPDPDIHPTGILIPPPPPHSATFKAYLIINSPFFPHIYPNHPSSWSLCAMLAGKDI